MSKIIAIVGSQKASFKETIFKVLKAKFKVNSDIILTDTINSKTKDLIKNSNFSLLVLADSENNSKEAKDLKCNFLILNSDNDFYLETKKASNSKAFTYGFSSDADFKASDINETNGSMNFKLNYKGSSIPVWIKNTGKEGIYSALSAFCTGIILGLNVLEISEALKP